jgi:RNA polymerase sigma factor (sigma-70 family)
MAKKYKANVQVYDETFYVDTFTGEGYDKVLAKIDPLLCKNASITYIPGYNFEDIKSELTIMAIEGILAFDPYRDVKLSTFLQTHLHNKKISRIRSQNKMSNDAFGFHDTSEVDLTKIRKVRDEIHFSAFAPPKDGEGILFEHSIPDENALHAPQRNKFEAVNFETSLMKISSKLDKKTRKIIELVYFEDYSIKDAAKEVNLSGWAASMRLKKLSRKGTFQSVFGQPRPVEYDMAEELTPFMDDDTDGSER